MTGEERGKAVQALKEYIVHAGNYKFPGGDRLSQTTLANAIIDDTEELLRLLVSVGILRFYGGAVNEAGQQWYTFEWPGPKKPPKTKAELAQEVAETLDLWLGSVDRRWSEIDEKLIAWRAAK